MSSVSCTGKRKKTLFTKVADVCGVCYSIVSGISWFCSFRVWFLCVKSKQAFHLGAKKGKYMYHGYEYQYQHTTTRIYSYKSTRKTLEATQLPRWGIRCYEFLRLWGHQVAEDDSVSRQNILFLSVAEGHRTFIILPRRARSTDIWIGTMACKLRWLRKSD